MELIFRSAFNRDLKKVKNRKVLAELVTILKQIENARIKDDIGGLKKLISYSHFYRIKIRVSEKYDYRLVLMIRQNKVWVENLVLSKKVFYRKK